MSIVNTLKTQIAALLGMELHEPTGRLIIPRVTTKGTPEVEKVKVAFPSGKVLVCDWPDLHDLTRVINREIEEQFFDLSTIAGCAAQTKFIADKYGFVSVTVGNTDPSVFFNGSDIVVGSRPYDDALQCDVEDFDLGYQALAEISTSYWWCTLIDMEVLQTFCLQHLDADAAHQLIKSVEAHALHRFINIEAGEYNLYFGNHGKSIENALLQHGHTANAIAEPKFVLSKNNLDTFFDIKIEPLTSSEPVI